MKRYKILDAREVIQALEELPQGAVVVGVGTDIHSDRGYYERGALEPSREPILAQTLADELADQFGKSMHGWKGGEFFFDEGLPIAVASVGKTGPYIAGFELKSDNVYEVVGVDGTTFW